MSKWSWFVISLCGGIATGIVFWSIAEPITHFIEGIPGFASLYPPESELGATLALATTYLHWGISEYAYYCVAGIAIGVAVYNMKLPYRVSACLYPILGKKAMGVIGTIIDILCVFGLAGGVSASLCEGALQLGAGIGILIHGAGDRGRGFASDALDVLCRYARQVLGLHQLWCSVAPDNAASLTLFRRAGFVECGRKREWRRTPDGWADELLLQKIF